MAMATTYAPLPAAEQSAQLRKAVIASTIGTAIEWYDFFLYGTAAGLIFGKLYFPNQEPLAATLAAFGTYFIGFASRPVGAAIFGHYGDRIGRRGTLIATLLRRSRVFGQLPGRNKLKADGRLLVSPFPEIKFIVSCCGVL